MGGCAGKPYLKGFKRFLKFLNNRSRQMAEGQKTGLSTGYRSRLMSKSKSVAAVLKPFFIIIFQRLNP